MKNTGVDSKIATAPVPILGTITVSSVSASPASAATGTITTVAASASSVTILAANGGRYGAVIQNDSTEILYLALSDTTASTSVYTVLLSSGENYELPVSKDGVYTGAIKGIWSSASGNARITEFTT